MAFEPTGTRAIALLGTGLLGAAIGQRLLQRGHWLSVWNRTPERCAPLLAAGAELATAAGPGQRPGAPRGGG